MIRAEFRSSAGHPVALRMQGHAMLAAAGSDIVCAAASVLAENLAAALVQLCGLEVERRALSGDFHLAIQPGSATEASDLLFASTLLGLRALAAQHPDRVQVVAVERE